MGASVGAVTKQTLFPPLMPAGRPFRVSNASRSSRKGIVASNLQELISKVEQMFPLGLKLGEVQYARKATHTLVFF